MRRRPLLAAATGALGGAGKTLAPQRGHAVGAAARTSALGVRARAVAGLGALGHLAAGAAAGRARALPAGAAVAPTPVAAGAAADAAGGAARAGGAGAVGGGGEGRAAREGQGPEDERQEARGPRTSTHEKLLPEGGPAPALESRPAETIGCGPRQRSEGSAVHRAVADPRAAARTQREVGGGAPAAGRP